MLLVFKFIYAPTTWRITSLFSEGIINESHYALWVIVKP